MYFIQKVEKSGVAFGCLSALSSETVVCKKSTCRKRGAFEGVKSGLGWAYWVICSAAVVAAE